MKRKMTNLSIIAISAFLLCACAPRPNREPQRPKLSADEIFQKADVNGDNVLTFEEFEDSLPKKR